MCTIKSKSLGFIYLFIYDETLAPDSVCVCICVCVIVYVCTCVCDSVSIHVWFFFTLAPDRSSSPYLIAACSFIICWEKKN